MATTTTVIRDQQVDTFEGKLRTRVRIAGDGPPLVFLHGALGLIWDQFLDSLAERFTVYAPEHPGTTPGDPDAVRCLDDLWDLVLHYSELFDKLGLDAPAVVGHSFGGMVGAEMAATFPRRVSKLVLIAPIGLWRDDAPVAPYMTMSLEELAEAAFLDPTGPVAQQVLALPESPEAAADVMIQVTWALACTSRFVWPIPDKGLKKRLYRITAPTLLLWGTEDHLVPSLYAEEFRSRIPNAQVEMLGEAGHMVQLEQLDQASSIVTKFLDA